MDASQIEQVKQIIDSYFELDLSEMIASAYSDKDDIAEVMVKQYTVLEYQKNVKKVFNQFREELKESYFKALPLQYGTQSEHGNGQLLQDLQNFVNNVKAKNFPASVQFLNRLIQYQALFGFWEKSKRKYFRSSEINVADDQARIELVTKHLKEVEEKHSNLMKQMQSNIDETEELIKSKRKELQEIELSLQTIRNSEANANDVLNNVVRVDEKIKSALRVAESDGEKIEDIIEVFESKEEKLGAILEDASSEFKDSSARINQLLEKLAKASTDLDEKYSLFQERSKYLDELIGREVGASLFETFKHRKDEINSSLKFWKWAIGIVATITAIWIYMLFGSTDLSKITWPLLIVNSLKALPAIGVLWFSLSQYSKERHYQEEYAFKSAVALTINAYSERLANENSKEKLIMDSVEKVYMSPVRQVNIGKTEFSELAKQVDAIVKNLKEIGSKST